MRKIFTLIALSFITVQAVTAQTVTRDEIINFSEIAAYENAHPELIKPCPTCPREKEADGGLNAIPAAVMPFPPGANIKMSVPLPKKYSPASDVQVSTALSPVPLMPFAASTYTWNNGLSGSWTDNTKWTLNSGPGNASGYPNAVDDVATFNFNLTNQRGISIPDLTAITIGTLNLTDDNRAWLINNPAGTGELIFDVSSGSAAINTTNPVGTFTPDMSIEGKVTLNDPLIINVGAVTSVRWFGPIGETGGAKGITKTGPGTLRFNSVTHTYTGITAINNGLVLVNSNSASSPFNIAGGILSGNGTTGPVTGTSGTLGPGPNPPGGTVTSILNVMGNVSLNAPTTFAVDLAGTTVDTEYDQLNVTGGVTLGGSTLSVTVDPAFTPALLNTFTIINNDAADAVSGRFAGLPNSGNTFTVGTTTFSINYAGGDGNDVVLTVAAPAAGPSVTINQAAAQPDPTSVSPIDFTVVFSAVVTGFATGDVTLSGTAGATTATVTGSGTTYNVAVTGMTSSGTVIATIPAGVAIDAGSNPNLASTSTDNTVQFNLTAIILLKWNTLGNAGTETTEPSVFNDPNISSSNLTFGPRPTAGPGNPDRFGAFNWYSGPDGANTDLAEAVAGGAYIQFIVTPNAGFSFTPTSLDFYWEYESGIPGLGPNSVTLRSSADGFTADIFTFGGMAAGGPAVLRTGPIGGLTNLTTATTFRLYGYGGNSTGGSGGFDATGIAPGGIENVRLNGTTAAAAASPTVTIDQAVAQPDPTFASPINFTVVFDQVVTGFATGDVTITGTAGATTGTVTGSGATYNVAVSGMTGSGTVIVNIPAGVCINGTSDPNLASTSTDNIVTFNLAVPCTTFVDQITAADPTTSLRAFRDGVVKTCAAPGTCQAGIAGSFNYKQYSWTNPLASPQCVTVVYTATNSSFSFVSVYNGPIDLTNTCTNWISDPGSSSALGVPIEFSFTVPASATINFLVTNVGAPPAGYSIAIYAPVCSIPCSITLSSAPGTDAQTVCINTPITNITYNTTGATGATFSGLPAGVTGNWLANVATISGTPTASGTFNYTVTLTGGCGLITATGSITVNPTPNAVATPPSQTVCSAAPITTIVLSGAVGGTIFNWTRNNTVTVTGIAASGSGNISGTLTNTTNAPITVTFTITPTANGCVGASIIATVVVNPTPTAAVVTTPGNLQVIITGNGNFADEITWTLRNSLNTIILSGGPYGFNPPPTPSAIVPAANAPFTFFIEAQGTFNDNSCLWEVRCNGNIVASGCIQGTGNGGSCTSIGTLTVPNISGCGSGAAQTICSGAAITPIVFSGTVAGTVFNWTRDNTVTVTGTIGASGSGTISGTLINTTNAPITVTFTITPVANGCSGTPVTATVLVNPTPNAVGAPLSQTICSGNPITTIVLSGAVSGTIFNWTRNNTVAVTGIAASGAGNISGTLTNTTAAPVTVTFTITPTANGCPGTPITATVLVNPMPTVNQGNLQVIITGDGNFADEITWTLRNSLNAIILSGGPYGFNPPPTPSAIAPAANAPFTFFIEAQGTFNDNSCLWEVRCDGNIVASGCIKGTGSGGSCASIGTLTVPNISGCGPLLPQASCSGSAITPIVLGGPVAGTVFNWTRNNTVTVTGTIGASGTGTISGTLINSTNAPITVTFTITPTANGCTGPIVTTTVVVNPIPNAVAAPAAQTICSGTAITPIVLSGNVAGTTFNWTRNNTATVTGIAASGSGNISGTLTNTTAAAITVTFTITPTANGCAGTPITATVIVQAPLTITCPANITVPSVIGACTAVVSYAPVVTGTPVPTLTYSFTGATTGSGSGTGSGSVFNVGVTTVTITATNSCGTVSCSFTITVTDSQLPVISLQPANSTVCAGTNATFNVVSTNALNYQWQAWNGTAWVNIAGANSSSFTVNNTTLSMNTNSYRVLVIGLCTTVTSGFATLYVNALPTISLTASRPLALLPTDNVTLTAVVSPGGGTYVWKKNGNVVAGASGASITLTIDDAGSYTATYTDLNGCVKTSDAMVVTAQPSDRLFVYPNPNTGNFHVRFYNSANEPVTVIIFDFKGAKVYSKGVVTILPYTEIEVNISNLPAGTYLVNVINSAGKNIGARKVNINIPQ